MGIISASLATADSDGFKHNIGFAKTELLRHHHDIDMQISKHPLRSVEDTGKIHFEKNLGAYLPGAILPDSMFGSLSALLATSVVLLVSR